MFCSRLTNTVYIRVQAPQVTRCCTQIGAYWFSSLSELEVSQWLSVKQQMLANDVWPIECSPCKEMEEAGFDSVRTFGNSHHAALTATNANYLSVGLEIDAKCNAACISCGPHRSSLFAKLLGKSQNSGPGLGEFYNLPTKDILEIDLYGGEPSISNDTQTFLIDLAASNEYDNVKKIRITTNASSKVTEIEALLQKGINVDISMSMDGYKSSFEYARWPIKWNKFASVVDYYVSLREKYPNLSLYFWVTYSALSVIDYDDMIVYSNSIHVPLIGSSIKTPSVLHLSHNNFMTQHAKDKLLNSKYEKARQLGALVAIEENDTSEELGLFLAKSDALRGITFTDYHTNFK